MALLGFQFRLASFQAATTGYGWPVTSNQPTATAAAQTAQLAAEQQQHGQADSALAQPATAVKKDTLVLYIFNEDDPIFKDNFQYFLLAGVQENSRWVGVWQESDRVILDDGVAGLHVCFRYSQAVLVSILKQTKTNTSSSSSSNCNKSHSPHLCICSPLSHSNTCTRLCSNAASQIACLPLTK